jgi:hypothetical protein
MRNVPTKKLVTFHSCSYYIQFKHDYNIFTNGVLKTSFSFTQFAYTNQAC